MILIIRIKGLVEIPDKVDLTLSRIRLRRKYSAILISKTEANLKLLEKIRDFVAYGEISNEMLEQLLVKRGKSLDNKKIDAKKIIEQLAKQDKEGNISLSKIGIKPFFRLHPPLKGIDSKVHFPKGKGVLGDNKEKINDLLGRML